MQDYPSIVKTQLDCNPRCLCRDLSPGAAAVFTLSNLHNLTLGAASVSIGAMQYEFQGGDGSLRMHGAGHYSMGGDGADVFTSRACALPVLFLFPAGCPTAARLGLAVVPRFSRSFWLPRGLHGHLSSRLFGGEGQC